MNDTDNQFDYATTPLSSSWLSNSVVVNNENARLSQALRGTTSPTRRIIVDDVQEYLVKMAVNEIEEKAKKEEDVQPIKGYSYRTFYIKKKNGKNRRICAPSPDLLKFQRSTLPTHVTDFIKLEQTMFGYEVFHGFIPNRNTVTCARLHHGLAHTITLDISNCFDSITKTMLSSYMDLDTKYFNSSDDSLAQGFATSPILSAIYLCKPMQELVTLVRHIDSAAVVTCYADDIQISLSQQDFGTMNRLISYATYIFKKFKLTINTKKTRIRHSKFGNRKILGIQVGETALFPNRKLKKKIRAARFQKNGPSLGGLVTASKMYLPKTRR